MMERDGVSGRWSVMESVGDGIFVVSGYGV